MTDLFYIFQWWFCIFIIGLAFLPITLIIFRDFFDRGYLFSKVIGIGILSYLVFITGVVKILPFTLPSLFLLFWGALLINYYLFNKYKLQKIIYTKYKIFFLEEFIFFIGILTWSYVRAHEPSIIGLEKLMDYGFLNSILRTNFQPAVDMWFTPEYINYYYFGHLTTAVITKLSLLQSNITYNLMIATIFSFTFALPFSLISNLITKLALTRKSFFAGLIGGSLVALSGNLHTIYSLFETYNVDHPVPFWDLQFLPQSFSNGYWYPNATRFIPFTIHEFPLYSFVVSDLHGHVVDIIYVMLGIGLSYVFFTQKKDNYFVIGLFSLFLSIMYMTNAWDGIIYMLLFSVIILVKKLGTIKPSKKPKEIFKYLIPNLYPIFISVAKPFGFLFTLFILFSIPFSINFRPFASGIGVLCAPQFLTNLGSVGPLLFENDHCQRSTWWQLLTLYGFFYFFVISFCLFILRLKNKIKSEDIFILSLILVSSLLILIPELIYVKDIYPAHYRANTMFKLVYQSFILLSLVSTYTIARIVGGTKNILFYLISVILLTIVLIYPYFAVKSYYADFKNYVGLDGTIYIKDKRINDYNAIIWINANIPGRPVIVEAQGDSYTDFGRVSANTGLPTILGWTVHEWLWRGTYDIPAPRIEEVKNIYESTDDKLTKNLLEKYDVEYIFVGDLEREKYQNLNEDKIKRFGKSIYESGNTKIYKLY